MIYQTFPSIRIQYSHSVVVPPHYDSDHLSNHPEDEKNFLVPITKMFNTNSIYIESEPGKKDFKSIQLNPGELFHFNGNKCTHGNKKNDTENTRISFDFRILPYEKYSEESLSSSVSTKKKFIVGEYYNLVS